MGSSAQTTQPAIMKVFIALSALVAASLAAPAAPPAYGAEPAYPDSQPSTPTSTPSRMTTPTTTSAQRRRETDMLPRDLTMSAFLMVVSRRLPTLLTVMVDMSPM